jgi:hypothetical protein
MNNELGNSMEGSSHAYFKALSQHLTGGTEKKLKTSFKTVGL